MKRTCVKARCRGSSGATLTELMVAVVILSVGVLGLFSTFRYIATSLFVSRGQTLATNLAQEKIEVLKNSTYYDLLITTSSASDGRFTPNIVYDTGNYPPETITISNIAYTRYTYVTMADVSSGSIVAVGSNYPDTGLKQIVVNVVWSSQGSMKKWTLTNLLENPSVNPLDATVSGTISISGGGGPLASAIVKVEQNAGWSATTNSSGQYSFQVYHGTYTVRASSAGFYDAVSSNTLVARGGTDSVGLSLTKIATGTVAGIVWYNPDLVISQVVADTFTLADDGARHDIEYVELFNPTTYAINIGKSSDLYPNKPTTLVYGYYGASTDTYDLPKTQFGASWSFDMVNVTTFVAPGHYYLYANASSFTIAGVVIIPDAYYDSAKTHPRVIGSPAAITTAGGIWIWHGGVSWVTADQVGWADNSGSHNPPFYNWPWIPNAPGNFGLGSPAGKQIVRVSSPAASAADITTYGAAYNSQNNANDFLYESASFTGYVYPPHTSASGAYTVISGRVPSGVVIAASDPYSSSLTAYSTTKSSGALSLRYVPFALTGVTTGTYTVALSYTNSGIIYSQIISSVVVNQNQTTAIPNAATSPIWSPASAPVGYQVQLSSVPDTGFLKGVLTDPNGNLVGAVTVTGGGGTKVTGSNGQYFMNVSSGSFSLIVNPNNSNAAYVQQVYPVTVSQGAVTTQDVVLSLGTRLTGYITTGSTPVPNQVVNALVGGNQMGTGTSDGTGIFSINNLSTGTYTVTPVISAGQSFTPSSANFAVGPSGITAVVNSTGTVFIGTFTVTGSYGTIAGNVTNNSALVTTGAMIIASTNSISSTPPTIYASSAPASIPSYMTSSKADGTYSLPVRAATYNLSVYVPLVSNSGTVTITTKTYSGITVSAGGSATQNVVLP